jgi:hypothetical protein
MLGVDVEAARKVLCCIKATKTWLTAGLLKKLDSSELISELFLGTIKRYSILNSGHEFDDKVRGIILISEYLILTTLIIIFETADNTITDSNVYMMCGESQQCRT